MHAMPASRRLTPHSALASLLLACLPALPATGHAAGDAQSVETHVQRFLLEQLAGPGRQVRVEVHSPAAQLPACQDPQPFLPQPLPAVPGRVMVGVRCSGGPTRYLQASTSISGAYAVSARALAAGEILAADMLEVRQGDLGGLPRNAVLDPQQAIGRQLTRSLPAASPLPGNALRVPPLVLRDAKVRVEARASGFVVSREAAALEAGGLGETIRVRTSSGEVIHARVSGPNLLAVDF